MLVEAQVPAAEAVSVGELKAYLRLQTADEDALLAGLLRSARAMCEAFVRVWLLQRGAVETVAVVPPPGARLSGAPVGAVTLVEALYADGTSATLTGGQFVVTYDADQVAYVSTNDGLAQRLRVTYSAGLATDWNGVAEPLRQGIVRLAAHMFANRDAADEAGPPAVVAALWRPYRRMRLGGPGPVARGPSIGLLLGGGLW